MKIALSDQIRQSIVENSSIVEVYSMDMVTYDRDKISRYPDYEENSNVVKVEDFF